MKIGNVEVYDHTQECIDAKNEAILKALEMIGIQAESHAVNNLTASGHIDTGLLRNSITHAVSGEVPKNNNGSSEYKADRAESKYRETRLDENGAPVIETGKYEAAVPDADANERAVYVGSNLEYANFIEYGTDRIQPPTHYIKNAIADHLEEYRTITEESLKNV